MKYGPKLNKYERREMHAEKLKNAMSGSGVYIYENNSDADLTLPKPTASGIRTVGPRKQFQGDSYYMSWVGSPMNLLKIVEVVQPKLTKQQIEEQRMIEDKLLLDQPEIVTQGGKVEYVVVQTPAKTKAVKPLNDSTVPVQNSPEVLLTEDPLDGVEIILG
jgi:hypothetical protein